MICSYHRKHSAMKINKLQYIQYRSISNFEREGQTQQVIYNIIAFRWSLKQGKTQQTIQGWRFIYKTHTHTHTHVAELYGKLKQILFSNEETYDFKGVGMRLVLLLLLLSRFSHFPEMLITLSFLTWVV